MNKDGWRQVVLNAVREADKGESATLDILAEHLEQCDRAKQVLRDKGYGWTGLDILETANAVVEQP